MSKLLNYNHYDKVTFGDLSLNGDASFNNDVFVNNNLVTNNDIQCNNRLFILGDASLNNDVYVKETFIVDGDASLNANLRVSNDATLNQRLFIVGDASLNSDLYIKEMLLVDGDASLNANLKVSNDATLNDRLFVSGDASFNNDVFISNNLVTTNDIQCNNRLFILGDVSWNPNNLANDCIPSTAVIGGAGGSSSFSQNGDDIYFNNGNVGIGTTSPVGKMQIQYDQSALPTGQNTGSLDGTLILTNNHVNTAGSYGANIKFASRWSSTESGSNALPLEFGAIVGYNTNDHNFGGGLTFWTHPNSNSVLAERMRITEDGNVGIGTTSPDQKLHTTGRVQAGEMVLGDLPRAGGSWAGLYHTRIHDDTYNVGYHTNAYCLMTGENGNLLLNCVTTTNGTAGIYLQANASTKMTVLSSGYVGIGNTAPGALLSVGDDSDSIPFIQGSYNSSYPPLLNVRDDSYADAGSIAHFSRGTSYFQMYSQSFSHKRGNGDMFLMYTSSGNVYIGNGTRSTYIKFGTNSTITSNPTTINSDDRIKYNETDISNCLGIVRQLSAPQRYERFIPKEENDQIQAFPTDSSWNEVKSNDDIHYYDEIGFIAQEIQQIPELSFSVRGEEYDASGNATPLTLDYGNIHNITTGAVKELDAIVQQQQSTITALETENATLKTQVADILARLSALENN